MPDGIDIIIRQCESYIPQDKIGIIEKAYTFAQEKHAGQKRKSGEPFIEHPLKTAQYLAELKLDADSIAAALLHDVMEDCNVSNTELDEKFGPDITRLVDGVTKLSRIAPKVSNQATLKNSYSTTESINLRKMLMAMAEDIRVVLIKLADRLHNMRTLDALPKKTRIRIAQETLDIYAPLAHRLGISDIKWRLEDLSFRHLQPAEYKKISALLARKRTEREEYVDHLCKELRDSLEKSDINAEVVGRAKHIYSIYQKTKKYFAQGKDFDEIYDLHAMRITVQERSHCYNALGIVHDLWHPIPGQFDDYIANPKENGYQSLHTTVKCDGKIPLEVQIRTYDMNKLSEYGVASHWRYKEGEVKGANIQFEERMAWAKQLIDWQTTLGGTENFLESAKTDLFQDYVFVYTPKGHIKELPVLSTPIDFAYLIHTDLGHRCSRAKINGKIEPLDYALNNGDTVEIIRGKPPYGPHIDWLNPIFKYANTARARESIRSWFRKQNKEVNMTRGRQILEQELHRLDITVSPQDIGKWFNLKNEEDLFSAIGNGSINMDQMTHKLSSDSDSFQSKKNRLPRFSSTDTRHLSSKVMSCCNPLPGDEINTEGNGRVILSIHRKNCSNAPTNESSVLKWRETSQVYPVRICVDASDRVGLLSDVTAVLSRENVNIASVVTTELTDDKVKFELTLFSTGLSQLSKVFTKIERVRNVTSAYRRIPSNSGVAPKNS